MTKYMIRIVIVFAAVLSILPPARSGPQAQQSQAWVFQPANFGFPMPDFALPAIQGGEYGPGKLKGKNVLFVFPRGKFADHWCQVCHYQYAELAELEAKLALRRTHNLEIVFVLPYGEAEVRHWAEIFPDQIAVIERWKNPPDFDKLDPRRKEFVALLRRALPKKFDFGKTPAPTPFPILYDKDQIVSKTLGLFSTSWDGNDADQNIPTVYLLDTAGDVRFKYRSQTTLDRPSGDFLVKMLDMLIPGKP